jgi:hypothetical protein
MKLDWLIGNPAVMPSWLFYTWTALFVGGPLLLLVVPSASMLAAAALFSAGTISTLTLPSAFPTGTRRAMRLLASLAFFALALSMPIGRQAPVSPYLSAPLLAVCVVSVVIAARRRGLAPLNSAA